TACRPQAGPPGIGHGLVLKVIGFVLDNRKEVSTEMVCSGRTAHRRPRLGEGGPCPAQYVEDSPTNAVSLLPDSMSRRGRLNLSTSLFTQRQPAQQVAGVASTKHSADVRLPDFHAREDMPALPSYCPLRASGGGVFFRPR